MPLWLVPIIGWISHNLSRTIGVIVVSAFLIGIPILGYKNFILKHYNEGYKKGYSQAMTDHPQSVGTMYMNGKESFFILKIWKLKFTI